MKTYFRIVSYSQSFLSYAPLYSFLIILSILFGAINITLLIPLIDILFDKVPQTSNLETTLPVFSLDIEYFKAVFNYYFLANIAAYGKMGALIYISVVVGLATFFANVFRYWSTTIINGVRIRVVNDLRKHVFKKLLTLHIGYFSNERKGDLMSRMTTDIQEVEVSLVNTLKSLFKEPMTILVYFAILIYTSWQLTLFTIVFLPLAGGCIAYISKLLRKEGKNLQGSLAKMLGMIDETLLGIKVIKAFNAENYIQSNFDLNNNQYTKSNKKSENRRDLSSPISEFLGIWMLLGIILYGGNLVFSGTLEASIFIAYIALFSQLLPPIKSISDNVGRLQRGIASGDRVLELLAVKSQINDKENAYVIKKFEDSIEFKNVSFAYEDKKVLKNINLSIKKGETIALVGQSGGGKSTLADLIPRFYDPVEGGIHIDGKDLRDVNLKSLRALMGIVTQESILFNDTIFNNIAFGIPNVSQEDVVQAAKIANADEFISKMENAYQTNIGDRGTKLSGGQRQRISIARAVLKNPPLLILDEATSALDSESEKLVQKALNNLTKNRTSLVIAHRLSTIQNADKIIVIGEGEIIEAGKHAELIAKEGIYKKLIEMQDFN
jgi:subfamily B ATP-binding cassette protein MsbA